MKKWTVSNIDNHEYVGIIEFQDDSNEWRHFEVVKTDSRIVFGTATNTGFMESGYLEIDDYFSFDENLQELVEDLECYYNDGKDYCSLIVCNDRM